MCRGGEGDDGAAYLNRFFKISVIISIAREDDGKRWMHFSVASPNELPTWKKLKEVRAIFMGNRKAVMAFPPKSSG